MKRLKNRLRLEGSRRLVHSGGMDGSRWNICFDSVLIFGSWLGSWRVWRAGGKLQTLAKLPRLGGRQVAARLLCDVGGGWIQ